MTEEDAQYRAGGVVVVLSQQETSELQRLFEQLASICSAACDTLGKAGPGPVGSEFQRFKELTTRLNASVERINSIIG